MGAGLAWAELAGAGHSGKSVQGDKWIVASWKGSYHMQLYLGIIHIDE